MSASRPLWSGPISFGLVSIPVQMFSATHSQELRFHFVDKHDLAPIGYDKVRKDTGERLGSDEIIRAFELEKGRYVPVTDEDIDRLDVELARSIEICDFVDASEIDPLYYRKAYHLQPQKGAEKPYALLVRALEETRKVGIATVAIRNKQYLAALRASGGALLLETMYYADEVGTAEPPELPELPKAEVEMAKTLVENLSRKFEPSRYHDRYREQLLQLLRAKAEGQELPEPTPQEEGAVTDLMAALRESVEHTKRQQRTPRAPARDAS